MLSAPSLTEPPNPFSSPDASALPASFAFLSLRPLYKSRLHLSISATNNVLSIAERRSAHRSRKILLLPPDALALLCVLCVLSLRPLVINPASTFAISATNRRLFILNEVPHTAAPKYLFPPDASALLCVLWSPYLPTSVKSHSTFRSPQLTTSLPIPERRSAPSRDPSPPGIPCHP